MSKKRLLIISVVLLTLIGIPYIPSTIHWIDGEMAFLFAQRIVAQRDFVSALRWLERTVKLNPKHVRAYRLMGEIYFAQKKYRDAVRAYEGAVRAGTMDPILYNNLGWTLIEYDIDYQKGVEYAKKSLEIAPGVDYTEDTLGWGYYKLGDYEQGLYWVERAHRKDPSDPILLDHYKTLVDLAKKANVDSSQTENQIEKAESK